MLVVVVWSWDVSGVNYVKVVIRQTMSRGRVVGVEDQLKQLAGFIGVLFGNELSSLVEGLHEEVVVSG